MLNLDGWIASLEPKDPSLQSRHPPHPPAPCFARPLPSLKRLQESATRRAKDSQRQYLLSEALNSPIDLPQDALPPPQEDRRQGSTASTSSMTSWVTGARRSSTGPGKGGEYESWHVSKAIEKKDVQLLHDIKTSRFDLLIHGTPLPLVYALRLGKSHHDMAILVVGAMSRKVNDTTDDELAMMEPATKATLRSLRANLKIAITSGLDSGDTSLLASFLQVIVMTEGDRWLVASSHTLSLAFRTGPAAHPVETAKGIMHKWVSRELKARQVAAVEAYVDNAVGDLCLLGLWSIVQDQVPRAESIPLYFFARDDRIHKAVEERLAVLQKSATSARLSKQLRSQLETALEILGRRNLSGRERIEQLRRALDGS
ncbi:hypothetical protein JCM5296_002907 [Sporobolomyces johnsonii]